MAKGLSDKIKNMSVQGKLKASYGSIIGFTFVLIVALLISLKTVNGKLDKLFTGPTMNIQYSAELYYPQIDIQRALNRTLSEGEEKRDELYPQLEETTEENIAIMNEAISFLKGNLLTQEDKNRLLAIEDELSQVVTQHRTEVFRLLKEGDYEAAREYNNAYYMPSVNNVKEMIEELEASIMDTAEDYRASADLICTLLIIIGIILLIIVTYLAVWMAIRVFHNVTDPLTQIETAAKQLREGKLGHADELDYESQDEFGELVKLLRESIHILNGYVKNICENFTMLSNGDLTRKIEDIPDYLGDFMSLKESFGIILKTYNSTLNKIRGVSGQVDSGSEEVASAAGDLAAGTSEQASAVEEMNATIETVSSIAEAASVEAADAYRTMMESVEKARQEKLQMQELQDEMNHIKAISAEIEAIVTSIEEIASQTNLLALNASIEAARAGEAGRGFAVVADQIGKLATDSANAVVSTKELIRNTIEEIGKGSVTTEKTAEGFNRIISDMENFAEMAKSNSEKSKSQSEALLQVEKAIEQISLITQQNAASSEECSAISEEMAARASELDSLVNEFKLYGAE